MRLFLHLAAFSALAVGAVNPQLEKVQAVYILPMTGGLDQFLANKISQLGKMQVVADPMSADAILTDTIGVSFEKRMDLLYAVKKEEVKAPDDMPEKTSTDLKGSTDDDKSSTDDKSTKKDDKPTREQLAQKSLSDARKDIAKQDEEAKNEQIMRGSTFGRGRGTFFLVDRHTRNVIWSVYEKPKNTSAEELNKTAEKVVNRLKHDLKPPVTAQK